jgi:hypothetical protein
MKRYQLLNKGILQYDCINYGQTTIVILTDIGISVLNQLKLDNGNAVSDNWKVNDLLNELKTHIGDKHQIIWNWIKQGKIDFKIFTELLKYI